MIYRIALVLFLSGICRGCYKPFTTRIKQYVASDWCPCLDIQAMQRSIDKNREKIISHCEKKILTEADMEKPLPIPGFHEPALLSLAYNNRNRACVTLLLKKKPQLTNLVEKETGNTVLHIAAQEGAHKIVSLLLDYLDAHHILPFAHRKNIRGKTALMLASLFSRARCVDAFLNYSVFHGAESPSLLHYAARGYYRGAYKQYKTIFTLYKKEAPLYVKNNKGYYADEQSSCPQKAKLLIQALRINQATNTVKKLSLDQCSYFSYLSNELIELISAELLDASCAPHQETVKKIVACTNRNGSIRHVTKKFAAILQELSE